MGQNQHIVPQIYLSNFTDQNSIYLDKPLRIFDKDLKSFLARGTKNFLSLNHFYSYSFDNGNKDNSIEKYLSHLESKFAGAMKRLISQNITSPKFASNLNISNDDRIIFAQFLLWQIKRTIPFMERIEKGLAEEFIADGLPVNKSADGRLSAGQRNYALYVLQKLGEEKNMNFLDKLLEKNLVISIVPENVSSGFVTSDNPVLITNSKEEPGIALEHTEISLPLTPRIALSFYKTGKLTSKNIIRDKSEIRRSNLSLTFNAHRYVIGPSDNQLKRLCKNL